ncbi:MAG: hypothetical protein V4692_14750 [Bdellovibrionota bacterium]
MKFLKRALLTISFLAIAYAPMAKADLLLEPYAGVGVGSLGTTSGIVTPVVGGRLGYAGTLIDFGVDYAAGVGGSFKSAKYSSSLLAGFIGIGLPLIHFWAGYGFTSSAKVDEADNTGTAVKFGLGLRAIPFVSLNLEYVMNSYTKQNGSDISTKSDVVIFSIGIPL